VHAEPLIPDRGEFMDALAQLRRGRVLVHSADDGDERCVIAGHVLYTAWRPLHEHGLLDELPADPRVSRLHCYRLSPRGREFAERAWAEWKRRPLLQRLVARVVG
jgi:hypothetical protein